MSKFGYSYVFVRKDIEHVHKIIQVGHACYELAKSLPQTNSPPSSFVLLEVENQDELIKVANYLSEFGVHYHAFYEPDNNMGYSAIATKPYMDEDRWIFRKFDLYKENVFTPTPFYRCEVNLDDTGLTLEDVRDFVETDHYNRIWGHH